MTCASSIRPKPDHRLQLYQQTGVHQEVGSIWSAKKVPLVVDGDGHFAAVANAAATQFVPKRLLIDRFQEPRAKLIVDFHRGADDRIRQGGPLLRQFLHDIRTDRVALSAVVQPLVIPAIPVIPVWSSSAGGHAGPSR
jgi:hypothetical protein